MTDSDFGDFWGGELTLPQRREEGAPGPFPYEQLAAPELEVGGRNLAALLAPVYRAMTS